MTYSYSIMRPIVRLAVLKSIIPKSSNNIDLTERSKLFFKRKGIPQASVLPSFNPLSLSIEELDQVSFSLVADEHLWRLTKPLLYHLFWSLTLYDISLPEALYQEEMKRLRTNLKQLQH